MVNTNQIKRGIAAFVDNEIMPHIPGGGLKKVAAGTVVALFLDNLDKTLTSADSPYIGLLGIKNEGGEFDVCKIGEKIKASMTDEGAHVDINVLGFNFGSMTFHRSDVDTLVRYITNA